MELRLGHPRLSSQGTENYLSSGPWNGSYRGDALWCLAKMEQGLSASSPPHALPFPAAVTGLMFLQVPPYAEVFRESLHTYKLNEQDTDVRAALCSSVHSSPSHWCPCP